MPEPLLSLRTILAKSGYKSSWGRFDDAVRCVEMGLAKGVGYELDGGEIVGIDLDNVLENGVIKPEAQEIITALDSYTEISPSGNGLHIFVMADSVSLTRHRRQGGFIEIYDRARYFTVTGNVYCGLNQIQSRSAQLQILHDKYLLPPVRAAPVSAQNSNHDNLQIGLERDPVLRACWMGERRRGDESGSDQALMNKLAYWLGGNKNAMMAAFLESPYYQQKDDIHKRKCQRHDYLLRTAARAVADLGGKTGTVR